MQDKKREMEKMYARMYIMWKSKIDENTNRPTANEVAKEKATNESRYQKTVTAFLEAQHECDIIGICVSAFEQRYSLIQTLSANIRKTS